VEPLLVGLPLSTAEGSRSDFNPPSLLIVVVVGNTHWSYVASPISALAFVLLNSDLAVEYTNVPTWCANCQKRFLRFQDNHTFEERKSVYLFGAGARANRLRVVDKSDGDDPSDFIRGAMTRS
jgi:hypothetical protein